MMEQEILDMLEWPATPSQGRLARAARVLNQNKRKRPQNPSERADIRLAADIAALAEYYDAQGYQEWATRTFIEECDRKECDREECDREECDHCPDDAAVLETMATIAHRGDTETTMGLALASRRHAPSSRTVAYGFAKLHRSPDWMGFCLALPRVQGLTVLVTESLERSKTPGMVLALPPENVPRPVGARTFPAGEARTLRQVLRWHGARNCSWITREPKTGRKKQQPEPAGTTG